MIARVIRFLWAASVVFALFAAWWSIRQFGTTIGVPASMLIGTCAVYASHPLLVLSNFVLSRMKGDPVPDDLRIGPARYVAMLDAEIDASVRGFWFATPFLHRRAAPLPNANLAARRIVLLFVHGYFCNRAVWLSFMGDAAARGYLCEAVTLDEGFAPIEAHALPIAAAIEALTARSRELDRPVERVVVVAHSMGGLAMRSALTTIDRSRVAHLITLGTPHHGTWPARFGHFANIVQMRVGSAWLAALAASEEAGQGIAREEVTTIWSAHDNIVYPQDTGRLEGARHVHLSGIGHVSLLYDRRVRDVVFERLEELALSEP